MAIEKFSALYFKREGKYYGAVMVHGSDVHVTGRTLAETKSKLRDILPAAIRSARKNMIYGKSSIKEIITVEIKP